jgi:hypothetical protein
MVTTASRLAVALAVLVSSLAWSQDDWVNATLKDTDELTLTTEWVKALQQQGKVEAAKAYDLAGLVQFGSLLSKNQLHMPAVKKAVEDFNAVTEGVYKVHAPGEDAAAFTAAAAAHKAKLLELAAVFELPPLKPFPQNATLEERAAFVARAEQALGPAGDTLKAYVEAAPNARFHLKNFAQTGELLQAIRGICFGIMAVAPHKQLIGRELATQAAAAVGRAETALGREDVDQASAENAFVIGVATSLQRLALPQGAELKAKAEELAKAIEKKYAELVAKNLPPKSHYAGKDAKGLLATIERLYKAKWPKAKVMLVTVGRPDWRVEWRAFWSDDGKAVSVSRNMVLDKVGVVVEGKGDRAGVSWVVLYRPGSGGDYGAPSLAEDVSYATYELLKRNVK